MGEITDATSNVAGNQTQMDLDFMPVTIWVEGEGGVAPFLAAGRHRLRFDMETRGRKRKASDPLRTQCLVDAHTGISNLLVAYEAAPEILGFGRGRSHSWARRIAKDELYAAGREETPFGTVAVSSTLQGTACPMVIEHVNPFAFFYRALSKYRKFARLLVDLRRRAPNGCLTVVLYMDKATPGNNKRHDMGRKTQAIYFSILEFPLWFLARRNGWLPFSYVLAIDQKRSGVTDCMLARFFINCFHGPSRLEDFETGIAIETQELGVVQLRLRAGLTVADWEELVILYSLTGYNGSVPCGICRNILGRCPPFDHPYLLHINSAEHDRYDFHTRETYKQIRARMEGVAAAGGNVASAAQETGIKYDPGGLIYDELAMSKFEVPWCEYGDWMHGWVASGGVAQYELNQVVLQVVDHVPNLDITDVDLWISAVTLPRGMCKLPSKTFFADRVQPYRNRNIKVFAAECLTAVMLMGFFIDAIVAPLCIDGLQQVISCFTLLRIILVILQRGDIADLELLRESVQMHHELFLICFPDCVKPKLHQVSHIYHFWKYWGKLLSCFGPERYHKLMMRTMRYSYRRCGLTALMYSIRTWFQNLDLDILYLPIHLVTPRACEPPIHYMGAVITHWSVALNTPQGHVFKKDILQWIEDGVIKLGVAKGFCHATNGGRDSYFALISECERISDVTWRRGSEGIVFLNAECIVGAVPYTEIDDGLVPLLHTSSR